MSDDHLLRSVNLVVHAADLQSSKSHGIDFKRNMVRALQMDCKASGFEINPDKVEMDMRRAEGSDGLPNGDIILTASIKISPSNAVRTALQHTNVRILHAILDEALPNWENVYERIRDQRIDGLTEAGSFESGLPAPRIGSHTIPKSINTPWWVADDAVQKDVRYSVKASPSHWGEADVKGIEK